MGTYFGKMSIVRNIFSPKEVENLNRTQNEPKQLRLWQQSSWGNMSVYGIDPL